MRTSAFEKNIVHSGRLVAIAILPGNGGILRRSQPPPED
jgi:hypothetical protein